MLIKDLKNGYPIYVLNHETLKAETGKVVSIGDPYFPAQKPGQTPQNLGRVVDVTLLLGEKTQTFTMPETLSVCYAGTLVFSADKEGILAEVRATRAQSQAVIDSYDKHQKNVQTCDDILEEWDTDYKERRRTRSASAIWKVRSTSSLKPSLNLSTNSKSKGHVYDHYRM